MATNVNRTELVGNLGATPEGKYSAAGTYIVTASIAVHSSFKQGEEWKERTDWFRLVAFGEAGEALSRFEKGERVRLVGRLQSSSFVDREGQKRTSVEVVVLRSDPEPLARRTPVAPEPEAPLDGAAEEPMVETEAPAEPVEAAPAKGRRPRRKQAA